MVIDQRCCLHGIRQTSFQLGDKVLIVGELSGEERTNLLRHYIESFLPTKDITKKQWEGYAEIVGGRFHYQPATLDGYLERVSLTSDADTLEEAPRVAMMTVHAAKGLEFDTVFITGMEEELFHRGHIIQHVEWDG